MAVNDNLIFEDVKIVLRNFSGRAREYNPAGNRNFGVLLSMEDAAAMSAAGWRVKTLRSKDPEDPTPVPFLPVAVSFKNIAPKIVQITSHGKVVLTEKSVGSLDTAEIKRVDLIVRPYNWSVQGNTGVKAYLKTMYVTIAEDVFESRYFEVPDSMDENGIPF